MCAWSAELGALQVSNRISTNAQRERRTGQWKSNTDTHFRCKEPMPIPIENHISTPVKPDITVIVDRCLEPTSPGAAHFRAQAQSISLLELVPSFSEIVVLGWGEPQIGSPSGGWYSGDIVAAATGSGGGGSRGVLCDRGRGQPMWIIIISIKNRASQVPRLIRYHGKNAVQVLKRKQQVLYPNGWVARRSHVRLLVETSFR